MPRAKVDVAEEPVTFRYVVCTPAPKVEVAVPSIVVVAVEPTYSPLYTLARVVDELANCCRAENVLAV